MKTSLYRYYDKRKRLLYIGISINPFKRLSQHKRDKSWEHLIHDIKIETFKTRKEAFIEEEKAIKSENPRWNKIHNKNRKIDHEWYINKVAKYLTAILVIYLIIPGE
jgi:predicted GIY-YIG superfamily endonuclease